MSPRSTTRHLYFWCFVSNSAFFKWHMSINEAKWTLMSFVLASSITSDLLLTFVVSRNLFKFLPFFIHCCFCSAVIFLAWGIGINLRTKLWCCSELSPFPAIWSSWYFGGFTGFQDTRKFWLEIIGLATGLPTLAFLACYARHGWSHRRFQFSSCILNGFFELIVLKVHEIDSS